MRNADSLWDRAVAFRGVYSAGKSIEATIEWRLTSGIAESVNAAIGRIRTNARGFHDPEAFIAMIMLDRASIAPDLPWIRRA